MSARHPMNKKNKQPSPNGLDRESGTQRRTTRGARNPHTNCTNAQGGCHRVICPGGGLRLLPIAVVVALLRFLSLSFRLLLRVGRAAATATPGSTTSAAADTTAAKLALLLHKPSLLGDHRLRLLLLHRPPVDRWGAKLSGGLLVRVPQESLQALEVWLPRGTAQDAHGREDPPAE